MPDIPSSAIKFYTAPTGGTEVTSGASGTTVYTRITSPFTEGLTGTNQSVSFPYYGRTALTGTKSVLCNGDTKSVAVNLPAYTGLFSATSGSGIGWSTLDVDGSGATWSPLTQIITFPKEGGDFFISMFANFKYVRWVSHGGLSLTNITINSDYSLAENVEYSIANDVGRVMRYPIDFELLLSGNSGLDDIDLGYLSIYLGNTSGALIEYKLYFTQASQGVLISDDSVAVAGTTGYSTEPIEIESDTTFIVG